MATAEQLRQEFMDFMDQRDIRYTVFDKEDNIVYLAFGGDTETFVLVDFDENDDNASSAHFVSKDFAKAINPAAAIVKLNEMNARFRFVKFFMSEEGGITADADAFVYPGSVGRECADLAFLMSNVIEEAADMLEGVAMVDENLKNMMDLLAMIKRKENE